MNTLELVNEIAQKNALTVSRAEMIINIIIERIVDKIKAGEQVAIPGFGFFDVVSSKPTVSSYTYHGKEHSVQGFKIRFLPDNNFIRIVNS